MQFFTLPVLQVFIYNFLGRSALCKMKNIQPNNRNFYLLFIWFIFTGYASIHYMKLGRSLTLTIYWTDLLAMILWNAFLKNVKNEDKRNKYS